MKRKQVRIDLFVPDQVIYFDRLVGKPKQEDDLKSFFRAHAVADERLGLAELLLLSSHPFGPENIRLDKLDKADVLGFYDRLEHAGDRTSQLGAIESGLRSLHKVPELAPHLSRMIHTIKADDPNDKTGRLELLSSLIILVDGELARTGICRDRQPFWRRLAAIAQASVIERAIVAVNSLPDDFIQWCHDSRHLHFYLQTFSDMRREPRWIPDFLSASQLRAEFIGRIVAAAPPEVGLLFDEGSRYLFDRDSSTSLFAEITFPSSFLPGPLEGGLPPTALMPQEIEDNLNAMLRSETITAKSFVTLVNSALLYPLKDEFALSRPLASLGQNMHFLIFRRRMKRFVC